MTPNVWVKAEVERLVSLLHLGICANSDVDFEFQGKVSAAMYKVKINVSTIL